MQYLHVPQTILSKEVLAHDVSWSPSMYRRVEIPTCKTKPISELLIGYDKGSDPGSLNYLLQSTHYLIRTKALQDYTTLICSKGDAIIPINPRAFKDNCLRDGDILLSKDSNIGECAIVDGDQWKNHAISGGIVRLRSRINRFYLFSFLKHQLFREELYSMVPRGATIAHANELWLKCKIPFPNQQGADYVECYLSALMEAIVDKERAIRERNGSILKLISQELKGNQRHVQFKYEYPQLQDVKEMARFNAAIYSHEYKSKIWNIENYVHGYLTPTQAGFSVIPGPSLEIKILRTRIDSDVPKQGFYKLLIPANISEYGTMNKITWLGTGKKLSFLQQGDILFGEAGFGKGRTIVLIDGIENATTNAHGLYARRDDKNIDESIFFRCIFHWYRNMRLIDLMAVGGSGGHFSPEYFDSLLIPNFPDDIKSLIVRLYHNPSKDLPKPPTVSGLVSYHRSRNANLGIWELDSEMKALQIELDAIQEKIIQGETVNVPLIN